MLFMVGILKYKEDNMPRQTLEYVSEVANDTGVDSSRLSAIDTTTVLFQNLTNAVIIEIDDLAGSIGTINWVRHKVVFKGVSTSGKATATVGVYILNDSNVSLWSQQHTAPALYTTNEGTIRTTDGSSAWTESSVNSARLKVVYEAESATNDLMVDYVALIVDYNEPPPETYDSLVQNAHLKTGNVSLKSGNVYI